MECIIFVQVHEEFPEKFDDLRNHDNFDIRQSARKAWFIMNEQDERIQDITSGHSQWNLHRYSLSLSLFLSLSLSFYLYIYILSISLSIYFSLSFSHSLSFYLSFCLFLSLFLSLSLLSLSLSLSLCLSLSLSLYLVVYQSMKRERIVTEQLYNKSIYYLCFHLSVSLQRDRYERPHILFSYHWGDRSAVLEVYR